MLKGLKVLDLSRLLPGPFATQMLAEMGADILKVEDTGLGDYARSIPPLTNGISTFYLLINRGKRSVSIDFKRPEGRDLILRLVQDYDVVVEGFRPGYLARYDLGYDDLKAANPKVIHCAITGFGQTGPFKNKAGHDLNYQALAGIVDMTGNRQGPPGIPGTQVADLAGGSQAAVIAILGAVISRHRTGKGQFLDIAMAETLVSLQPFTMSELSTEKNAPARGDALLLGRYICYYIYETKDGRHMSFAALEPKFFMTFLSKVDRSDLTPFHFSKAIEDNEGFVAMKALFKSKTQAEWVEFLADVDVCCEPVLLSGEVAENAHFKARNLFFEQTLPGGTRLKQVVAVPVMAEKAQELYPAAPLGEHTTAVMNELNLSDDKQKELEASGIIRTNK